MNVQYDYENTLVYTRTVSTGDSAYLHVCVCICGCVRACVRVCVLKSVRVLFKYCTLCYQLDYALVLS